jgi:uncharacterized protein involved in tellurium resistance
MNTEVVLFSKFVKEAFALECDEITIAFSKSETKSDIKQVNINMSLGSANDIFAEIYMRSGSLILDAIAGNDIKAFAWASRDGEAEIEEVPIRFFTPFALTALV